MYTTAGPLKSLLTNTQRVPTQTKRVDRDTLTSKFTNIGATMEAKTQDPVSTASTNKKIFEEFIQQSQRQQQLLLDATDEQKDIFIQLDETIRKLKDANVSESKALRAAIDKLAKKLEKTPDTKAKTNMQKMAPVQKTVQAKTQAKILPFPTAAERPAAKLFTSPSIATKPGAMAAPAMTGAITPANYALYEDAGLLRSEEDPEDQAKALAQEQGGGGGFWDTIKDIAPWLLGYKALGKLAPGMAKNAVKGVKGLADVTKRRLPFKDVNNRWRTASGNFMQKPGMLKQLGLGALNVGKFLGTKSPIGMGINLGLSGYEGYQEYQRSGDIKRAASAAGGSFVGGMLPGAAGLVGNLVGGDIGAGVYDAVSTPVLQNKQAEDIGQQSTMNSDLEREVTSKPIMAPPIVVEAPRQGKTPPAPLIIPRGDTRPSESALERYTQREAYY